MPIVTITSDFGWHDFYLPILKGAILTKNDQIKLVDITHDIEPYDIVQAAYIFKNTWHHFPKGSIHLISVNDYYQKDCRYLACEYGEHFFIAPDNGLFSLIFENTIPAMFELSLPKGDHFPIVSAYANAIGKLSNALPMNEIGSSTKEKLERITLRPVISPHQIRGSVIHIDRYGNVITNITKTLFEEIQNNRKFKIFFKRHDPIKHLSSHYHDVGIGELLCLFNHAQQLEIAVNMGEASTLFGLQVEDTIQIDFSTAS
ncbi:MAG: SAM-dependent chlorinase/fluorinase [Saprospiraceae bacterium]|nr:SAM-dependent chlorinase/fluorinase [Saprospiraceae bacterium]